MFNGNLFEQGLDIVPDVVSQNAASNITGDIIDVTHYDRAYLLIQKPAGSAGDDLKFTINQAKDNSGSGSKGVNVSKLWHKVGTLNAVAKWTAVELSTPASTIDLANVAGTDLGADTNAAMILVEVFVEDLDTNNNFNHVQVTFDGAEITAALTISSTWILAGAHYAQATPLSPIG